MLISSNDPDERLTTAHRAKLAYVYVRQSSVNEVHQHQESTELHVHKCGRSRSAFVTLLEDSYCANRASGPATDLEREAYEAEATASDEFVEIEQAFHVGNATFAADLMGAGIQLAFG